MISATNKGQGQGLQPLATQPQQPEQKSCGSRMLTTFGLATLAKKLSHQMEVAKNSYDHSKIALKTRAISLYSYLKAGVKNALATTYFAGRRAAICGSILGSAGGFATALAVGLGISNPLIGAPLAIGAGIGATGLCFLTGAGFGVAFPAFKGAGRRLTGMNVTKLEKENAQLRRLLAEQREIMGKMISDPRLKFVDEEEQLQSQVASH